MKNTRHKRRRTFQFKWIKFEFTETIDESFDGTKSLPTYEIELEICDTKFFNQVDFSTYLRLVERFIQNINSIITTLKEGEEIYFDTFCGGDFDEAYLENFETEVRPVVGDYLATKAYVDKNF
mmetsp:Transcript_1815/g.1602  ORF Transcript_1815/g.1602 Transcript_1815/m.1602 type:complete len:123 (+) Transcript_1815:653-1021(+)